MHPTPDRLAEVPLFDGVSDDERARIASWLEVKDVRAGTSIMHEGASGYSFFVLESGVVRIVHEGLTLATLGPGDVFGELAILGDGHRHADVIAETDAVVLSM